MSADADWQLALQLSRARETRPPSRLLHELVGTPRRTCKCGAHAEPKKHGVYVWCGVCGVFLSRGGAVRCVCHQAMPPPEDGGQVDQLAPVVWIQCDHCQHYLHAVCIWGDSVPADFAQLPFVCLLCDGADDDDDDDDDEQANEASEDHDRPVVDEDAAVDNVGGDDVSAPVDEEATSAPKKRWLVCGVDGCGFAARSKKTLVAHRGDVHAPEQRDAPINSTRVAGLPRCACFRCRRAFVPNMLTRHLKMGACARVAEPADENGAENARAGRKRKASESAVAVAAAAAAAIDEPVLATTAFADARPRLPAWQQRGEDERARGAELKSKIRALEALDAAFLETMNGLFGAR